MRPYWRILLDVRRCLRFYPALPERIATQGLRASDFEDRVVTAVRWEDAEGIRAHCMRLHRIGLTVSASRDDYRGEVPWDLGPCWPQLPTELQELPGAVIDGLWREPAHSDSLSLPGWIVWCGKGSVDNAQLIDALARMSGDRAQRRRRRVWLLRVSMPHARCTLLLIRCIAC